jgi:hypothetical protein
LLAVAGEAPLQGFDIVEADDDVFRDVSDKAIHRW